MNLHLSRNAWIAVGLGAFVVVAFCCWCYFSGMQEGLTDGGVPAESKGTAEVMLFFTTWCPHCTKAKPAWAGVKSEFDGKTVNGYTVKMTEVDCTDENEETAQLMSKYGVTGYPTVKMVKPDGSVVNFDAKPTGDALTQFIQDSLSA